MASSFHIIASHGVVIITHSGHVSVAENMELIGQFQQHPDARPGQTHIVDCSGATSYDKDWLPIMRLHALMAEVVPPDSPQMLLVIYAPAGIPREIASLICKSWDDSGHVIPRVVDTEAEALALAGKEETRLKDLLANA